MPVVPTPAATFIKVYGLRTPTSSPAFVAFTEVEEMFEWIKSDLDALSPKEEYACRFEVKFMTQEQVDNLPETDL